MLVGRRKAASDNSLRLARQLRVTALANLQRLEEEKKGKHYHLFTKMVSFSHLKL